ncbi:hypothetical protein HHK36_002881 [Tetracentron sinense]|uniref:Uncharacterized protein n=1 Tax=Tetracentron sinense TaxID=13715 RepID=A0A835DN62_TETSI|nr:hypothetical protein HHK36_002881 [Tetracentron sinense]
MGFYRNLVGIVRGKFGKSSPQETTILLHIRNSQKTQNHKEDGDEEEMGREEIIDFVEARGSDGSSSKKKELTEEDLAAIKIQAFFRGHIARRAFRALRSLVKLQAVVRGVHVRKQARVALHCMHALVRLQVRVRTRQLLSGSGDD